MEISSYAQQLIEVIDELYVYQAGPMGSFICEEVLENWPTKERQLHHMQLPVYIEALLKELPEGKQRAEFVNALRTTEPIKSHEAIKNYLKNFKN